MPLTIRRPIKGRREVSGIRLGDSRAERERSEAQVTLTNFVKRQGAWL